MHGPRPALNIFNRSDPDAPNFSECRCLMSFQLPMIIFGALPRSGLTAISVIAVLSTGLIASRADPSFTFEAESGALGSDWIIGTDGTVHCISSSTKNINGGNPTSVVAPTPMFLFQVQQPDAFDLQACIRAGPRRCQAMVTAFKRTEPSFCKVCKHNGIRSTQQATCSRAKNI